MADYKLTRDGSSIRRTSDGACIPICSGNTDYVEYAQWIVDGGVPDAAETLEESQNRKKNELRSSAASDVTASGYAYYRQFNINELQGFSQEDKDAMWVAINYIRAKCNTLESGVDVCSGVSEVDAISW
jgi:hypothetical protein